jgi:two-component sensor histidine kinase
MMADFGDVIRNVTATIQPADRFDISGPPLTIGPRATLSLSMLTHELSTNAVKYGALSVPGGKVSAHWSTEGDELMLRWRETNGPETKPPARRGFGSRLIQMGLIGTGGVALRYPESGFEGEFRAPLPEIQHS